MIVRVKVAWRDILLWYWPSDVHYISRSIECTIVTKHLDTPNFQTQPRSQEVEGLEDLFTILLANHWQYHAVNDVDQRSHWSSHWTRSHIHSEGQDRKWKVRNCINSKELTVGHCLLLFLWHNSQYQISAIKQKKPKQQLWLNMTDDVMLLGSTTIKHKKVKMWLVLTYIRDV